jgi:cytochrome b6-f complex iron-sulfur subunit
MSFGMLIPAVAGCNNPNAPSDFPSVPTTSVPSQGATAALVIDSSSPLANTGGAMLVAVPGTANFLVARTGPDTFVAVTAECTHVACQVTTFDSGSGTYECPCHGSQFSTTGTVRRGPASRDLKRFNTRFENGVLTITLT